MNKAVLRRVLGLAGGAALMACAAAEIAVSRADLESPRVQPFCQAGLCAEQFSPGRVFEIGQKSILGDPRGQLDDFKRAVRLSPASAYRWADLGEAEVNVRDYAQAEYAFSQALKAGPRSPVILIRAANAEFQIGNSEAVIKNLYALLNDPELIDYYDTAFLTYSRLDMPVERILRDGVPQQKVPMSGLLAFWAKTGKVSEAVATWKFAQAHSLADSSSMGSFFYFLVKAGHAAEAQQLWQDYSTVREPGYRGANWIYNGGFEQEFLPSPFDWKIFDRQDVEVSRVSDVASKGKWCLRIRFNGENNTAYRQTQQNMVLPPGRYRLSAMVRTEQVTTDEGVRIHVVDPESEARLSVWSDTATGTQDWTKIENSFEVPASSKTVRIEFARQMSNKFDNKIGGTTWIDEIRLSRQ